MISPLIYPGIYSNYPYSHFGMGGNFSSVVEYLREWIEMNLRSLEASNLRTLKKYKAAYLPRIKDFIECGMRIPHTIEAVPQVTMHYSLGPQNILLSKDTPTRIVAILDWEIFYRHPFMVSVSKITESFFRISKPNGTQGPCYDRTEEPRKAFWGCNTVLESSVSKQASKGLYELVHIRIINKSCQSYGFF
jgi:hypothetical protein